MIGIKRTVLYGMLLVCLIVFLGCRNDDEKSTAEIMDKEEYDRIVEFAEQFISGPVLGVFDEKNYLPVIYFCTAKMILEDNEAIEWTDREGCAKVSEETLTDYIATYFDVPADIVSYLPMGQTNSSSEIYRTKGEVVFFDYFHPDDSIDIEKIEKNIEDERIVYVYCQSEGYIGKKVAGGGTAPFVITINIMPDGCYKVKKLELR